MAIEDQEMPTLHTSHFFLLALFLATFGNADAQSLRELAREQALRNPGVPLEQTAPPGDYRPRTIDELTRESDIVVNATLSRVHSYLSESEDRILTDYSIVKADIVAGRPPSVSSPLPGPAVPLILTVYGGDVVVEGVPIRGRDNDREAIKDGGRYLLFLKQSRRQEKGRYELYDGAAFEVVEGRLKPLLRRANELFKDVADTPLDEAITQVQRAAQGR